MRNSLEVAKYIQKKLDDKNMSGAELARRTGLDRSSITRYFNGTRKIPMDEIPKFAAALGLEPAELLLDETECNLKSPRIETIKESTEIYVPLPVHGEVYCGEGEVHDCYPADTVNTPEEWITGGEHFYLIAKGDSMTGAQIHEGDLLLIRKQPIVENGEIAAVIVDDKRMLKRVYKTDDTFTLVSENPIYPPIIYRPDTDSHIRILGKLKKSITNF